MHVLLQYQSKVITLSGRRFITVSGGFITLSGSYYSIGRFYYIIGQLLQYRAFITLSVGTGVLLYINETIPAYEVQLQEEADCNEAIWCKLVTGHTTVAIGVVYRCPNITKQNNETMHRGLMLLVK